MVIIRTCSGSGQANLVSFETCNEQVHLKTLLENLPVTLRIQCQISSIITRAHKTLTDLGLLSMTKQQERIMDALLRGFNIELNALEDLVTSSRDPVQNVTLYTNFVQVGITYTYCLPAKILWHCNFTSLKQLLIYNPVYQSSTPRRVSSNKSVILTKTTDYTVFAPGFFYQSHY